MHNEGRAQESRVRRLAQRHGYRVHRSRESKHVPHADNHGEFMLIDNDTNCVALGQRFDASLDEIEGWLKA